MVRAYPHVYYLTSSLVFVVFVFSLACSDTKPSAPPSSGDADGDTDTDTDTDTDSDADSDSGCIGDRSSGDEDSDDFCNNVDRCDGNDAYGNNDGDEKCDDVDLCPNSNPDDVDLDGICDNEELAEDCDTPYVLEPYVKFTHEDLLEKWALSDFYDDWADDYDFSSNPGCDNLGNWDNEMVVQAALKAGQSLEIYALSVPYGPTWSTNIMVRVMDSCTAEASCIEDHIINSDDVSYSRSITATEDKTYFVFFEHDADGWPSEREYNIELMITDTAEANCQDGADNDGDGLTDCVDSECYGECGAVELFGESFDSSSPSSWNVTVNGAWIWSDANNITGGSAGYLHLLDEPGLLSYWMELDLTTVNPSEYTNLSLLFWHDEQELSNSFRALIQVSYDDGANWIDVVNQWDFDHSKGDGMAEVFDLSWVLSGRPSARLRFFAGDHCPEGSTGCVDYRDWLYWDVDDVKLVGWNDSATLVTEHIDTTVDFSTKVNQSVDTTVASPNGTGENCADAFSLTLQTPDQRSGDDFVNRTTTAAQGCEPNAEGHDGDHSWGASEGCTYWINEEIDWSIPIEGADLVWRAEMQKGDRLYANSMSRMDALFLVLESGCDPVVETPTCSELFDPEGAGLYDFTAPKDGTYHLVLKTQYPDPCNASWQDNNTVAFDLSVTHYKGREVHCDDGADNDGDGQVDCDDPNCFETCGTQVLFSEFFSLGLPHNFELGGYSSDQWAWCGGIEGTCNKLPVHGGSDQNHFSDSGGGYMMLAKAETSGYPSMATPPLSISGVAGENIGISFALKTAIAESSYFEEKTADRLFLEVIADGQVVIGRGTTNEIYYQGPTRGNIMVPLTDHIDAQEIQIRFVHDDSGSGSSQSWQLDDLMIVTW